MGTILAPFFGLDINFQSIVVDHTGFLTLASMTELGPFSYSIIRISLLEHQQTLAVVLFDTNVQ